MVFSSLTFIYVFLPIVLIGYYLIPSKAKYYWLLLANLVFYGWGEPVYVVLMLFSIFINFISGLLVDYYSPSPAKSKIVLVATIIVDIALLGYFKYAGFILQTFNTITGSSFTWKDIILPLGISFYTFQAMSYPIDVYWKKVPAQKNILIFGTYISMFPQLIAGPIVRYEQISRQFTGRNPSLSEISSGIQRFIIGLSKKVLIANNVGLIWDHYSTILSPDLSLLGAWLGIIAFTLQIYFDFSGYSDMAIGLGKMLGFSFPENFRFPYMSSSITEFWRRWHISLGSWFRDYVYIPLGGNRKGIFRQILNIIIVWAITGLWHGASWNFVLWGLYYAVLLIIEKLFLLRLQKHIPSFVNHLYALIAVVCGWVLFQITSIGDMFSYLQAMFSNNLLYAASDIHMLLSNAIIIIAAGFFSTDWIYRITNKLPEKAAFISKTCILIALFLVSTAFLVNETYNPFLYFRF